MSARSFQTSLLRPPVLHILRAAGFHSTRSSVLDTVAELAARYLMLLANTTAMHYSCDEHFSSEVRIEDVRMAMEDCGVFRPQLHTTEEEWLGEEDLRGVESFVDWFGGDVNREIMRVAGAGPSRETGALDAAQVDGLGAGNDFLTALKKKHGKTGNESRYQGTMLGKSAEEKSSKIEGASVDSLQVWAEQTKDINKVELSSSGSGNMAAPPTDHESDMVTD